MTALAYGRPFQLLSSDEVKLLVSSTTVRNAYIDCLALLQGVVAPFSSRPGLSVFVDAQLAQESITEALAELPPQVAEKMAINRDTAFDLRGESINPQVSNLLGLVKLVDDFLEGLVTQYQILRSAGSEQAPKVLGANANF